VPLGDLLERSGSIISKFLVLAVVLLLASVADRSTLLGALLFVVVSSTVAQQIVPEAASLVFEHRRSAVISNVMNGLLAASFGAGSVRLIVAHFG